MKSRIPRYAGVVAAMIALVLITGLLAVFGTVDVIFMKNGLEVGRQENVTVFSDVELYTEEGVDLQYNYVYFGMPHEYGESFKIHSVINLLFNTVTFNFSEGANDFVINVSNK